MPKATTTLTVTNPHAWVVGSMARVSSSLSGETDGDWIVTAITGFELTLRSPTVLERIKFWLLRITWKLRARWVCWRAIRRVAREHADRKALEYLDREE